MKNSLVDTVQFQNRSFYIKRDDLLGDIFNGNKARKFYFYLHTQFPHIKKLVSHGSNQSNAMYSLSVLAKLKGWDFEYFVDHIPSWLRKNPVGNYKYALQNGMKIYEQSLPKKSMSDTQTLYIPQGGANQEAQMGIELLAKEIVQWAKQECIEDVQVFLPSGTGTTALYLQKYLPFRVFTTPCVGDACYLQKQMNQLENEPLYPTIVSPPQKFHFGKLYLQNYQIWQELLYQTGIEFDLLYDPIGWQTLLYTHDIDQSKPILYIHQGGLVGNETMRQRYERKFQQI